MRRASAAEHRLPVQFIGIRGRGRPVAAKDFARAIAGIER